MRNTSRPIGRAPANGWFRSLSGALTRSWLLGALAASLVLLPVFGQSSGDALSIRISASTTDPANSAFSHVLIVSWKVTGGVEPYRLILKITGPDGAAIEEEEEALEDTRSFGLAYPAGGNVLVSAEVVDAAGASVTGSTHATLTPLQPSGVTTGWYSCAELAFSTEEDFVTRGPLPPDGNRIISDGDLLGKDCVVCARNQDLLQQFDVTEDLGLDAVDVIDIRRNLVAFSTELDSPNPGQFTAGDLLLIDGGRIPNAALLFAFQIRAPNLGLDALHFVGEIDQIAAFLTEVRRLGSTYWTRDGALQSSLRQYEIDIWFSTEGTPPAVPQISFLDGDLLSARDGIIVARNSLLLPGSVPAGLPNRGVDFGLDAVAARRSPMRESLHFSTEILYRGEMAFTDGDVLQILNGVIYTNHNLVSCFEPEARFLGLDALFISEP